MQPAWTPDKYLLGGWNIEGMERTQMPDWTFYLSSLKMATPSFQQLRPEFSDNVFICYTQNSIYQKITLTLPKEIPPSTFSSPLLLLSWPLPPFLLTWITKATSQSSLCPPGFSHWLFSSHHSERFVYVLSPIVSCLLTTLQCFQKMNFTTFIS